MQREVRCLYRLLLKPNGKVLDLYKVFEVYEEWDKFREFVRNTEETPGIIRSLSLPHVEMPQYLKWIRKYLMSIALSERTGLEQ